MKLCCDILPILDVSILVPVSVPVSVSVSVSVIVSVIVFVPVSLTLSGRHKALSEGEGEGSFMGNWDILPLMNELLVRSKFQTKLKK